MTRAIVVEAVLSDLKMLRHTPVQALRHLLNQGAGCGLCPLIYVNRAWMVEKLVANELFGAVETLHFEYYNWLSVHLHETQQDFREALLRRVVASKVNELSRLMGPDEVRRRVLFCLGAEPDRHLATSLSCLSLPAGLLWRREAGRLGALDALPRDILTDCILRPCLRPALSDAGLELERARALDADVLGERQRLQKRARVFQVPQVALQA